MSNRLSVAPLTEWDWCLYKQNVKLKGLDLVEMMSLFKSSKFEREHIKQMRANARSIMQTLDLIDEALTDMELELNALENIQLQIQLGDANKDEIALFEKREAQD